MAQLFDIMRDKNYYLALRKYSCEGNYFLFKLSKSTGDIMQIEKLPELPEQWTNEYIDQLVENGNILKSKLFN